MKKVIIYDSEATGHHLEYVEYLLSYAKSNSSKNIRFYFIIHPRASSVFPNPDTSNIELIYLEDCEVKLVESLLDSNISRSKVEWKLLLKYQSEIKAERIYILNLNAFQFSYLSGVSFWRQGNFDIHGILFHPYHRIEVTDFYSWFTKTRKRIQTYIFEIFMPVSTIFILNDENGSEQLNRRHCKEFKYLPDPVSPIKFERSNGLISNSKVVFTFLGFINKRKGIIETLDAFQLLPKEIHEKIVLKIFGQIDTTLIDVIEERIRNIASNAPGLEIVLNNSFIDDRTFEKLLNETDIVLMPYLRAQGSSGLLGHAAKFEKMVLGPEDGLIGYLIKKYELGKSVDMRSLEDLKNKIAWLVHFNADEINVTRQREYVKERTPDLFAQILMGKLYEEDLN